MCEVMPRTNISLDEDVMRDLKDLAKEECRSLSKQIEYLLKFYKEHK